jgi:hypothetical protein
MTAQFVLKRFTPADTVHVGLMIWDQTGHRYLIKERRAVTLGGLSRTDFLCVDVTDQVGPRAQGWVSEHTIRSCTAVENHSQRKVR